MDAPSDSAFDITLQIIGEIERDHPGQETILLSRDSESIEAELQVFRNSPVKDGVWEADAWYQFENISLYSRDDNIIMRAVGTTKVTSIDRGVD